MEKNINIKQVLLFYFLKKDNRAKKMRVLLFLVYSQYRLVCKLVNMDQFYKCQYTNGRRIVFFNT